MNKYEALVEFHRQGKTDVLGDDQVPLCVPQAPYEMARDRSRASDCLSAASSRVGRDSDNVPKVPILCAQPPLSRLERSDPVRQSFLTLPPYLHAQPITARYFQ